MKKETIFCDICKREIVANYWDEAPSKVEIKMTPPAQIYESHNFHEVCRKCRMKIGEFITQLVCAPETIEELGEAR